MVGFFVKYADIFLIVLITMFFIAAISFVIIFFIKREKKNKQKLADTIIKETKSFEEAKESEIENVLSRMQKEIEAQSEEVVKSFEEEQEEKSIISYKELLEATKKTIEEEEQQKFKNTEFISPIYGRVNNNTEYPVIKKFEREEESTEEVTTDDIKFDFKPRNEEITVNELLDLEKTINTHNLKHEMLKNEKFLNALKEFRKNLE